MRKLIRKVRLATRKLVTNSYPRVIVRLVIEGRIDLAATFFIRRTQHGEYEFSLAEPGGLPLLSSAPYSHRSGAVKGIHSVRANASIPNRYLRNGSSGEYYFVLISGNRQVICHSPMFQSPAIMDAAIEAVMETASGAPVIDAAEA